ncbi:MAG: tetratricopeptide repeat protein, partial [Candidatus Cloacimonadaceae bacterium]|nr:tetratricopeptide repeat protein [Candidatus Cloacimonadaceae bacterium]
AFNQFPDNDLISQRLATAYQRSNRINEAIQRYEQVIQNNPSNVFAYLNVVSLYRMVASETTDTALANQMYARAIETMNRLRAIQPENGLVYLNLASIYLAQNNNTEADNNARTAISKDPSLYQAYIIQAMVQQARGTTKYNEFIDLEKRAAAAVGRQATTLSRDRDAAKTAAATHFRSADELLKAARSRTSDPEVTKDINARLTRVAQLLSQATAY